MRRYNYFHAFVLSFFSKSFYQDVGRHWRGTGLAYLLVLLALVWIPTVIKGHLGLADFVTNTAPGVTEQIPPITIKNGKASADVPMPHVIKDPKSGATLAIIDTTDNGDTSDATAPIVLTRTKLIMNKNERETRVYDLATVGDFSVDRAKIDDWLAAAKSWFFPIVYPFAVLFSFIFRSVQILIYALIGMLFSRMLNVNLDYKTLLRLAAVAITPVMLFNLMFEFLYVRIPFSFMLGIAIGLGYLFFAVKANADLEEVAPYQPPPPYANPAG